MQTQLRVTVGTDTENDALVAALRRAHSAAAGKNVLP
jgi:histidinol-phosphate/aromatic aminotransferase/cobyric acid decarboxylase-like protein